MRRDMTVVDHALPDRVSAEVRPVKLGRAALTVLAAVLYALGWVPAKAVLVLKWCLRTLGFVLGWCVAAVRIGWREGFRAAGDG